MKAFILAAGRGSRLGSHTADKPKGLLPIEGKSLLVRNIENLKRAGFEEVYVVVGYRHEMIEEVVQENFSPDFCKIVQNSDYTRGSGSSLICFADKISGEMMILESDLLYDQEVVERIAGQKEKNIFAKGNFGHDRQEIKIFLENGYVSKAIWSKEIEGSVGDWVGFTRLSSSGALGLKEILQNTNPSQENEFSYEEMIFELIRSHSFEVIDIDDLPWVEIDNEEDLKKAETQVFPQIVERGHG